MELLDNETEGAADAGAAELAPGDTQVAASGNGGIQRDVEAEAGRAVTAAARQRRLGQRQDGQFITSPPKSKAGTRTIALDEETAAVLRTHADRHGQHGFVFTRADGEPDLRHGAASLALAAGTDLKVVQDMLGHASIVLTADTYTSVLPETARQAAADTAALIRDAGRIVPGTRRTRRPEYPRRLEPEPEEFPEAA